MKTLLTYSWLLFRGVPSVLGGKVVLNSVDNLRPLSVRLWVFAGKLSEQVGLVGLFKLLQKLVRVRRLQN